MVGGRDKGRKSEVYEDWIGTESFRVSFSVLLYITYGKETGSVL